MKKISSMIGGVAVALVFTVVGCGGGSSKLNKKVSGNTQNNNQTSDNNNILPDGGGSGSTIQLADTNGAWLATRYEVTDPNPDPGKPAQWEAIADGFTVGALIKDGNVLFGVIAPKADCVSYGTGTLTAAGAGQLSLNGHDFGATFNSPNMNWTQLDFPFKQGAKVDIDWRPFDSKSDKWPSKTCP